MKQIVINAPAKINLSLDVLSKREDGYHNIDSIMQSVTLFDRIVFSRLDEKTEDFVKRISFFCTNSEIPCDEKNLAHRAALSFFEYCKIDKYDIRIEIRKTIPVSAGLAGGSSDAAATLLALNELYDTELSPDTLCEIGKTFGADVSFCIKRGTYRAGGIGEILEKLPPMPKIFMLVAIDGYGVSTPWAYGELDRIEIRNRPNTKALIEAIEKGDADKIIKTVGNVFEEAVLPYHQKANALHSKMKDLGADAVLMSGSGPSVVGFFKDEKRANFAKRKLKRLGIRSYVCEPYEP